MNKTKLKTILLIGLPIIGVGLTAFLVISIVLGWYTNAHQMGKIDANTKNAGFVYEMYNADDPNKELVTVNDQYQIANLAFFDIDSYHEGKYFKNQVIEIELKVKNITSSKLDYSIVFESTKIQQKNGEGCDSSSYVGCIFSETKLGTSQAKGTFDSQTDYYSYNENTHEYTKGTYSGSVGNIVAYSLTDEYIPLAKFLTEDKTFKANKLYYTRITSGEDEIYHPVAVKGNNISKFKNLTGYDAIYELTYTKYNNATYNSSTLYYKRFFSETTGDYYIRVTSNENEAKENGYVYDQNLSTNFNNYYLQDQILKESNDVLFQNEDYWYYDSDEEDYIKIEVAPLNGAITSNKYYEDGSKVESLFETTQNLKYINTRATKTSFGSETFKVEYNGGYIQSKDDYQIFYLYLFGVQEIDSASNEMFLYDAGGHINHSFTISIEAVTESEVNVEKGIEEDNDNANPDNGDGDDSNGN